MPAPKLPVSVEIRPKRSSDSPKEVDVSDVHFAADLMDGVIGQRGIREPIKAMLERAYRELSKKNDKWTRRRVRAVWNKEAQRIEHREVVEMKAVIEARKRHAAYREETAHRVAMALGRAADRHSGEGAELRG